MAEIEVDVDLEILAWTLTRTLTMPALMEFILQLDELRANRNFTKKLHAELGVAIEKEENNG